ncbi:(deoxy)nucleoside triphosphate pyrophosphohydrolase [Actinomadura fibrosa]
MHLPLKWEFPGGKVNKGEELESCLEREIKEELGIEINIIERLPSNKHIYSQSKSIELIPFRCSLQTSEIELKEHLKIEWVALHDLNTLDWAAADIPIVQYYIQRYQ